MHTTQEICKKIETVLVQRPIGIPGQLALPLAGVEESTKNIFASSQILK